jgi:hypothetical protein
MVGWNAYEKTITFNDFRVKCFIDSVEVVTITDFPGFLDYMDSKNKDKLYAAARKSKGANTK